VVRVGDEDTQDTPHVHRVVARGDIDVSTAPLLKQQMQEVVGRGATIVVLDVSDVNFVDSSGIRVIVEAGNGLRDRGGQLLIEGISAAVGRILEITGLLDQYRADG
jgi:anti-sigma B factor antagonist